MISFSGTATGTIMMTLNASGGATFSRAGVDGKDGDTSSASVVTIDNIASKSIAASVALKAEIERSGIQPIKTEDLDGTVD